MAGGAQDENALVERVFLRIGSAETDQQLQTALGKFLAPLLLKLNSADEGVRSKVLKLLAHIKTRLKSRSQVALPMDALLTQFQDPTATPFITNFTILFIKLGFPRLEAEKQAELVPLLMNCVEGRSVNHQDSLLQLMLPALQHLKLPKNEADCRARFPLTDKPAVKKLLLDYFMDVLLLPYNYHQASMVNEDGPPPPSKPPPPGLSETAFKRVTGDNPLVPEELEKVKLSILRFLGSGVVEEEEVVCLYVVAVSDTRHSVATSADLELKRITGSVDWNSKEILGKLFSIFQGTVIVKGQSNIKAEDRRSPVSPRIRLKIFPFFLKAREAGNQFPACLRVVFDCLFGPTPNAKLRTMAVEFVHHICLNCDDAKFAAFDVVFLNGMLKVIKEASEDAKLRSLAYVAVGKIGRRSPHRLTKDIQVVQTFFDAICKEDGDTRLAVQEALSLMSEAFGNLDDTNKQLMEALLLQNIDKEDNQVRGVTVQYAASVFSAEHIPSRYILLLGTGDIKEDTKQEALRALRGGTSRNKIETKVDKLNLPDFGEMVNYLVEKGRQRKESQNRYVAPNAVLPFNPTAYTEIILYLRQCLAHAAGQPVQYDLEQMPEQAPLISPLVQALLVSEASPSGPVQQYMAMLQELLSVHATSEGMYCLLELVAMVPDILAHSFLPHLEWLKGQLANSKDDYKQYVAELYAIVSHYTHQDNLDVLKALLTDKNPELASGALLSLGFLLGLKMGDLSEQGDNAMEISPREGSKSEADVVKSIVDLLENSHASTRTMTCIALGEIGRRGALPLDAGVDQTSKEKKEEKNKESNTDEEDKKQANAKEETNMSKLYLVNKLINMVKTSNENLKTKERAAMCLAKVCAGDPDFPHRTKAIEDLMNSQQGKQVELHFTIGQALVTMAMGQSSPQTRCLWTTTASQHQTATSECKNWVGWFLEEILNKYICNANPHLRQAACIWLLTLMKDAGHHKEIQDSLLSIQRGFMSMLSANDEITQELASKGLGQVMEICSSDQKDKLVQELVDTLMTGKSTKTDVTADTTVFQSGALGKAPDGASLSTYKELCAIATDLNQPDLIYKFMHLANHNATWNARKGAAFGFSTIAAQAGEQLAPYMSQIVPRLYRYQFDPNPKIQQAMSGIWSALVQDNKKTVDTYQKQIVDDLLKNLTSNQWRTRESSCLAVCDLLRGRVLDDILDAIPQLWEECLRARDDIKESVRLAADSACKTLSKVSIKICDVSNGKTGEKAIQLVVPCLLHSSLQSSVSEVRAIGLSTILQISRNAGALLKPHIPVLVTSLLEAVSGLEPQMLNYLSLHTGTQATQEKVDNARLAVSKMSPMMETVNRCVQYVDSTVLPELVPRLVELIRGGIGVGTKAGCSSFVVSVQQQCPQDLSPYAGKLMSAFLHGLGDRNATIRKSYATALGHLVRIGKDSSVEKLIQKLKTWYLESEDSVAHHACSVTLHAISQHSSDCLRRHAQEAMPLAFFAMHEEKKKEEEGERKKDTSEWEDVWNEITPGTEAGVRIYLPEIVTLLSACINSQAWSVKAQAGRAMGTVASKLGDKLVQPHLGTLMECLLCGLSGRTWTGKEALLEALGVVCTSCKQEILKQDPSKTQQPSIEQVLTVVLRESGKSQVEYKLAAMKCLGSILELYSIDNFKAVWNITYPIINSDEKCANDDDDKKGSKKEDLLQGAFTLLGQAWPVHKDTQDEFTDKFVQLLCNTMTTSTWKVQVILLKDMYKVIERSCQLEKDQVTFYADQMERVCTQVVHAALINMGTSKYVALRSESLSVLELVDKKMTALDQQNLIPVPLQSRMKEQLVPLADSGPWELRDRAKLLLSALTTAEVKAQPMEH